MFSLVELNSALQVFLFHTIALTLKFPVSFKLHFLLLGNNKASLSTTTKLLIPQNQQKITKISEAFQKYSYSGDLNTGQVWFSNGKIVPDWQMVPKSENVTT